MTKDTTINHHPHQSLETIPELLSFIVPVYNEEQVLPEFYHGLVAFLKTHHFENYEIVFVNDGSNDRSFEILQEWSQSDEHVRVVNLTRNFGKEVALTAGLDQTHHSACIPIDADMQHPFHVILEFVTKWREGYDVVYAVQMKRKQRLLRRTFSRLYYRLLNHLGGNIKVQPNAGDFRLLSSRAVNKLKMLREQHRVMKSLYSFVGLRQTSVSFDALPRRAGNSKWNLWQLFNLAVEGITAHSTAPLRLATLFGLGSAVFSILFGIATVIKTMLFGEPIAGYPTLITVILFLGSVQLVALGIIGEYLGRVFNETKDRPLYLVEGIYRGGQETSNDEWQLGLERSEAA